MPARLTLRKNQERGPRVEPFHVLIIYMDISHQGKRCHPVLRKHERDPCDGLLKQPILATTNSQPLEFKERPDSGILQVTVVF